LKGWYNSKPKTIQQHCEGTSISRLSIYTITKAKKYWIGIEKEATLAI